MNTLVDDDDDDDPPNPVELLPLCAKLKGEAACCVVELKEDAKLKAGEAAGEAAGESSVIASSVPAFLSSLACGPAA